jgi:serine/threonine protein kinase
MRAGFCPKCLLRQGGFRPDKFEPPTVAEISRRLGDRLEILEVIGHGGMGAVYKCRQTLLNRLVALKVIASRGRHDADLDSRLAREARLLARLDHPNIVKVHEFSQAGDLNYFVMDYVAGQNLRQLQRGQPASTEQLVAVAGQICDALQHAHEREVIHRDIKPENILIDGQGQVKIVDFGLARAYQAETGISRLTMAGQVMGTPHYMSPEQVEKPDTVDHRSDLYALGVVLYEWLTGELPLGRFEPPSARANIDSRWDALVMRALEKDVARRYQQARQIKDELGALKNNLRPTKQELPLAALDLPPALESNGSTKTETADGSNTAASTIRTSWALAVSYRQQGQFALSILEHQRLLRMLSESEPEHAKLIRDARHDMQGTMRMLETQHEIFRQSPAEYRYGEALKSSYIVLEMPDQRDDISRLLARAYVLKEKFPLAVTEYEEILRRYPADAEALKALAELKKRAS